MTVFEVRILHDDDFEHSGYQSMIIEEVEALTADEAISAMRRTYTGSRWAIWHEPE